MKYLIQIVLISFTLVTGIANAADCRVGETRCNADGRPQECISGIWMTDTTKQCGANIREQKLCTDGDEKCGAAGKILVCRNGKWDIGWVSCKPRE